MSTEGVRGRKHASKRARLGLLALVLVVGVAGLATALPRERAVAAPLPATSLPELGFYPGYASVTKLKTLETWIGRNASHVVQFADQDASQFTGSVWGQVANVGALQTIENRVTLVESIPLAFGKNLDATTPAGQALVRSYLQATVSGANDAKFKVAAKYLRDGGFPDAIIRIGWEFDGGWYPWSSRGNEALWITAYRRVALLFRTISPAFRFDWNGTRGSLDTANNAYPGDDVVDIVGLDVYDKGLPVAWNSTTKSWSDPAAAFNVIRPDLAFHRNFAIARGKQLGFAEWGLTGVAGSVTSAVGGDNPTFVKSMSDWFDGLPANGPGSLAYQSYFNANAQDGHHIINTEYFPKARVTFLAEFGVAAHTSVGVTANVNPSVRKQRVTLTATATDPAVAASALGGTMKFYYGTRSLGSVVVTNGVATLATTKLPIGAHDITAKYTRVVGLPPVVSPVLRYTVNRNATSLTVTSSNPDPVFGEKVTLTAKPKAVAPGTGVPKGTVTFTDAMTYATVTVPLVAGKAVASATILTPGESWYMVQYNGSTLFTASTLTFFHPVTPASSQVTLGSTPVLAAVGTPVTFTATVTSSLPSVAIPTGSVTFSEGTASLSGPIALGAAGTASFTTSGLAKGTHTITARYSGSAGTVASTATITKTIL